MIHHCLNKKKLEKMNKPGGNKSFGQMKRTNTLRVEEERGEVMKQEALLLGNIKVNHHPIGLG